MRGLEHIHDNNLAEAIARTGKSDVGEIQELNARRLGIRSLKGIEQLSNLRKLHLGHNKIGDIAPLCSLEKLTGLFLEKNNIDDISPLCKSNAGSFFNLPR
ncbi:MAG: leucine-rich repeat domain-containing protein, partial [Cyanobacteria bacterium J06626_14]